MSKKRKIIITAIIIIFSSFLITHNFLYYFSYKNKAKKYVVNHFKTKYNSDVKIKKVTLLKAKSRYTAYVPISQAVVEYKGKECLVLLNTFISSEEVYDNCQEKEIKEGFKKYINKTLNVESIDYKINYIDDVSFALPYDFFENIGNVIKKYYDGNNYKDILKNGHISLSYDTTDIDENVVKNIFKDYPKSFDVEIKTYNKRVDLMKSGVNESTCIKKEWGKNGFECVYYRKDFGNIKAYSAKNILDGASISTTDSFDISLINDKKIKNPKIVSPFYKTTNKKGLADVSFVVPVDSSLDPNKKYIVLEKTTDNDGKFRYFSFEYNVQNNLDTLYVSHYSFNNESSIIHVLLEVDK